MKKITILLTALLLATTSSPILARRKHQKIKQQRAELKVWKKRKAAMSPLQLKELIEENQRLKKHVKDIQDSQEALEELLALKTQLLAQKEAQQEVQKEQEIENVYDHLELSMIGPNQFGKNDWALDENGRLYIKGIVFKVQIGAYKKRDLHHILQDQEGQEIFVQEQSEGLNRYTLMHFKDYWQADQFKKELRAMGLKDAFVVAFQDGKRVSLKAVLPTVIQQKK